MTEIGIDSKGRRNPAAWRAWARGMKAPEQVAAALVGALVKAHGGAGARARRALRRAANRCADCGVQGALTGHMECQYPQNHNNAD